MVKNWWCGLDEQVVTDCGITTSHNPGDRQAFKAEVISLLSA